MRRLHGWEQPTAGQQSAFAPSTLAMWVIGVLMLGGNGTAWGQNPANPFPVIPTAPGGSPFVDGNSLPLGATPVLTPASAAQAPGTPNSGTPNSGTPAVPMGGSPMPAADGATPGTPPPPLPGPYSGVLSDPLLSPAPLSVPTAPKPNANTKQKVDKYIERLLDPESTLDLIANQTRVLVLKNTPFRVQAGDEKVLSFTVSSPTEILLQGKEIGATVLNLWFGDKDDPAKQETLTYLIRVYPDPQAKERLERAYAALEKEINGYFKDTSIRLKLLGDKLVVSGRVRDYTQGQQVLQIIRANMSGGSGSGRGNNGGGTAAKVELLPTGGETGEAVGVGGLEKFQAAGGPNIINLLEVAGEQQVMLRVVVAEVNRAAARSIGLNFSIRNEQGITVFANTTGGLLNGIGGAGLGGLGGGLGGGGFGGRGGFNGIIANFDAGRLPFALKAMRLMQYSKSLAEPTLVAMNGQTASFLAGGQFPVPVLGGFGNLNGAGSGLQGVSYVPYGVQLSFTPFITDRDRIRLRLNAAVSTRDVASGTNIGGAAVSGLNSRNVNTIVELRQGETLAVAGLIESNQGADSNRLPFLGQLPIVGPLTGVTNHTAGEKELVIFVTPEMARPIDPQQIIRLPGHEILDPNDLEFYVLGRIEGHTGDFRSPIRTSISRVKSFQKVEQANVFGPSGYTPLTP
ncbi:type ii and iii secretion system protein : Type II and III secretion system protein OS=Pirellula staleyi (strain ATCC 27377 / DSM 6068 / ICPB 4128) GN=Psta_1186 PE=4 SV=1: T2SS-T3SS_pil_N: Secretin [Tuwongella immobilis]|uniref:Uncharacterized protein n=2 Tax=Tuwongella immobilis TaxID=692036 RepID=A0A6C2YXW8_9BACT|nr:type ii and iii secretion system protein : Type II and III secretion system protein OS=Pirellula staleyi (strain ATCC 27377 / DSM 6068 / ICPB 4128) GN=Psta_1186 PE=4 SV=1: T2SS-T3SS_pil_N: Secretin [Tuwongella immobilis]VTS08754.1 type ii and iii secretion system protein : Type II and III secretion system protein OS=Pirellula staleyi (strain ATCC 27377 / DSM 6068 / ICPB 4128) GN=Psta_1186 PE=4 SV=1: T2SS-T3SS_pil_N: Secretin [Tuwongella immobilis]